MWQLVVDVDDLVDWLLGRVGFWLVGEAEFELVNEQGFDVGVVLFGCGDGVLEDVVIVQR